MEYILRPKGQGGCVFCEYAGHGPESFQEDLVLCQTSQAYVVLNRYPFASGHLLVVPRHHCANPGDLSSEDHDALFRLVTRATERLKQAVKADGMNVGINLGASAGAGIAEHLHVHLVPRWPGDTNFMPVLADVRVMPQALDATWRHLRPFFEDLSAPHAL